MPPLTEIKIKSIKPTEKTQRFFDGGGLYLEVTKAGSKYWRWKYRINGKEKRLAFGVWPEVSLREARDKRDECRAKLRAGEDPGEKKEKGAKFEAIAEAWRKNMGNVWSESHATTVKGRLKLDVYLGLIGRIGGEERRPILHLAARNLERNPGRSAASAATLFVCALVGSTLFVGLFSITSSYQSIVNRNSSSIDITVLGVTPQTDAAALTSTIRAVDGVQDTVLVPSLDLTQTVDEDRKRHV